MARSSRREGNEKVALPIAFEGHTKTFHPIATARECVVRLESAAGQQVQKWTRRVTHCTTQFFKWAYLTRQGHHWPGYCRKLQINPTFNDCISCPYLLKTHVERIGELKPETRRGFRRFRLIKAPSK